MVFMRTRSNVITLGLIRYEKISIRGLCQEHEQSGNDTNARVAISIRRRCEIRDGAADSGEQATALFILFITTNLF